MKHFVLFILALLFVNRAVGQNPDALSALTQFLGETEDPQVQLDVLKGMSDGLKGRRAVPMPAGWEEVAAKLARSPNDQVRELSQSLSVTFGSKTALARLRQVVLDRKAEPRVRQGALETLLGAKDPELVGPLQQLVDDPQLRAFALRGLAAYDDATTPSVILKAYPNLPNPEKKDALNTLVSRVGFARKLLAALGEGQLSPKDLTADVVRQLNNLKDSEITKEVQKIWGVARETEADKLKEIAKYKALLQNGPAGNVNRGRVVFSRTCQQCHVLFDAGAKVGPDITGSNRGDLDYILQNIIDPNAVIPNDYRTSTLETKDDRVITGIVTRQDDVAVTIVTQTEQLVIPRKEVQSLTQGELSMMPEGFVQSLSEQEVRDLVAYLKSPQQVPLPPSVDVPGKGKAGE